MDGVCGGGEVGAEGGGGGGQHSLDGVAKPADDDEVCAVFACSHLPLKETEVVGEKGSEKEFSWVLECQCVGKGIDNKGGSSPRRS